MSSSTRPRDKPLVLSYDTVRRNYIIESYTAVSLRPKETDSCEMSRSWGNYKAFINLSYLIKIDNKGASLFRKYNSKWRHKDSNTNIRKLLAKPVHFRLRYFLFVLHFMYIDLKIVLNFDSANCILNVKTELYTLLVISPQDIIVFYPTPKKVAFLNTTVSKQLY